MKPLPEPSVASRTPGLVDFGEVDLAGGPDLFGEPSQAAGSKPDPSAPAAYRADDPLAGLSLADLDTPAAPTTTNGGLLPPAEAAPPLDAIPPADGPRAPTPAPPQPPADAEQDAAAEAERSRRRLRTVGVNALSLVALVAVAVVLLQVWRARQSDGAEGQRGPAVALDVASAPYETTSGKAVVVVRGRIQASEPMDRAVVRVELLDGGRPVASGTALAGAIPTAEEVHAVTSGADADRLLQAIASRAPPRIRAGEVLPFTAVVADPPADLRALEVRVSVRPER